MDIDEIDYKTLRRIQQLEKNSPLLTKIDSNFYFKLSEYLKNLDKLIEKEDNSQKNKLLQDEIQNTKKIATGIYEQREKKIVQAALSKARGGRPDLKNLLNVEKPLYDSIINLMMQSRKEILNNKAEGKKNNEMPIKPEETVEKIENTNPIVRVTTDIPEFIGTDMKTYSLRKDDVLSLPKEMSEPLLKRDVIKQIK